MRSTPELRERRQTLLFLRLDKNTASVPDKNTGLGAAPLTCCGEERADLIKADHTVKKNLNEKRNSSNPFKMWDWRGFFSD